MSRVYVYGLGAVSPAGWGVPRLRAALAQGCSLPVEPLARPGWEKPLSIRKVPNSVPRPALLGHPRLRRASPISHYAAAAANEALEALRPNPDATPRLGLIVCLFCGCLQHTYRFFEETLQDPATASPLIFPETVFAAPASHLAALLGHTPLVTTLVGDPAIFLQGVDLAIDWLHGHEVEACLVVGAEEMNWLLADALFHLDRRAVPGAGAGALCLGLDPALSMGVELTALTGMHTFSSRKSRVQAARQMRRELPPGSEGMLLCDGVQGAPRSDAPELTVWRDWTGPRLSPKSILGEGLMAAAAWQCVAACDRVAEKNPPAALVSLVGCNQQAMGACFAAPSSGISAPSL